MSALLSKLPFTGRVERLLRGIDRQAGLEKAREAGLNLLFSGIEGDFHGGLTVLSDSRMLKRHRRGTEVKNARQVSILSIEELAWLAARLRIPEVKPEWVGANLVTAGIPDLTLLPPSTRLQFPSNATICIDIENAPCRWPGEVVSRHHPGLSLEFVKAATNKRGLVGWIEREGVVREGDAIAIWLPPQRLYAHGLDHQRQAAE